MISANINVVCFFFHYFRVHASTPRHQKKSRFLDSGFPFPPPLQSLKVRAFNQLPYFSTELTVACRESCTFVCVSPCAVFGQVPMFSLHQCSSYGSLQGPLPLQLHLQPQTPALVGSVSVAFSSHHKEDNSPTVSPFYINTLCLALELTITGPPCVTAGYSEKKSTPPVMQTEAFGRADSVSWTRTSSVHSRRVWMSASDW